MSDEADDRAADRVDDVRPDDLLRVWHEPDGTTDHAIVVHVAGEIDLVSAPKLDEQLRDLSARSASPRMVLDLTEVTFLSSVGLSLLVQHSQRCRQDGVELRVVTGNRTVARAIAITGLADTLTLFDTLDDAITRA